VRQSLFSAGVQFYSSLCGRLQERLREMSFCRQRLRHMQDALEEPTAIVDATPSASRFETDITPGSTPLPSAEAYWEAIRETETARLVLPNGESDLEQAAVEFLQGLNEEQWVHLEQTLQDQVLAPLGGVHHVCSTYNDLARSLASPILTHLVSILGEFLPVTDVAQVEFSAAEARQVEPAAQIQIYHSRSTPLLTGAKDNGKHGFLLVPASETGKNFGEEAKKALPELDVMRVPGQADLMFCREQGFLTPEELRPILNACRPAYEELAMVPNTSPHARFDVTDWVPVDP
jgi:hypothetical protein